MKPKGQLTSIFVAIILFASAISSFGARKHSMPRSTTATGDNEQETFVVYQNENSEVACREADPTEHLRIINRKPTDQTRIIYAGAPVGPQFNASRTWTDSMSGLTLQLSAGLRIVLHGTPQLEQNQQARNAFIVAANRWEAIISTPITAVIDVDFGPSFFGTPFGDPTILGQTASQALTSGYSTVRQRLISTASNPIEQQLYDALPASAVPVEVNGVASEVTNVRSTLANARALGLTPDISDPNSVPLGQGDSTIGFNSAFTFDFDPTDGISSGQIDFDSIATHEIGHALGFSSRAGQSTVTQVSVWDLFRLGRSTANLASFPTAPRLMSIGGEQVFFPNQVTTFGTTSLQLSTGGPNPGPSDGDGRQSSHWKDDALSSTAPYIGIMDPTLNRGLRRTISENDISAIDLFGYSIGLPPPVRPPNDNFVNAISLQSNSGSLAGANVNATRESGEPIHVGFLGDKSVWYTITATQNGQMTIDTVGSNFDTTLSVYLGTALNQLSVIAQNDDIGGGNQASRVTFNITAGTTYRIVVDGWNGEFGNITLNWTATEVIPTPTPTPTPADLLIDTFVSAPNPTAQGQAVNLVAHLRNVGPGEAVNPQVTINLPAGLTFIQCQPAGCTGPGLTGPGAVVFSAPTLSFGNESFFDVAAQVAASNGSVMNSTASVSSSTADPNLNNNSASSSINVNEVFPFFGAEAIASAADGSHVLALRKGMVWAWGRNFAGQLGDGTELDRESPVQVDDLMFVTQIGGGSNFSVALKNDGTVWTWGDNRSGHLGVGSSVLTSNRPIKVPGLGGIVAISVGSGHTLALKADGSVWGWGGGLGFGMGMGIGFTPTMIPGLPAIKSVFAGQDRSWVVDFNDNVRGWGINFGALGDGTNTARIGTPTLLPALSGLTKVASGSEFTVVIKNDSSVWSFGVNTIGQLGQGGSDFNIHAVPAQIPNLAASLVSSGFGRHTIVTVSDGLSKAFGANEQGQLGIGIRDTLPHPNPTAVPNITSVFATTTPRFSTFAVVGSDPDTRVIKGWGQDVGLLESLYYSSPIPATVAEVRNVAKPIFSVAGGNFTAPVPVFIGCGTLNAIIHYTTNGQDPTESDPVALPNVPINVDRTLTLKARAWRSAFTTSLVSAAFYDFNLLDSPSSFVRQQYLDFLGREPNPSGLNFWTNEITSCGSDQSCIEIKRINVSAAFFLSIEFQQTGFLVERAWDAAYEGFEGPSTLGGPHNILMPRVLYLDFFVDKDLIARDVIVGDPGWQTKLENNTTAYFDTFVQRTQFTAAFPISMTAAQFVDQLKLNTGNALSSSERDQLVAELTAGTKSRAQVLRAVAEDSDFANFEFNRAFVLMQYYGYLRRNPNSPPDTDFTGYDFWLRKLNQFNGNFVNAEMVKAFLVSGEYRQRFGP